MTMEMQKRYSGEFLSRKGITWRVDIMQMADAPFAVIGDLDFPGYDPLSFSWEEVSKEIPVIGSTATLTIISPGDRTYEDLYTVMPGAIRLDVYRENVLYWCGALDPEFYEEPYERADNYDVSLTFTDFGILDRLKFDGEGMIKVSDIIGMAIGKCGIAYNDIDMSTYISTKFKSGDALDLSKLSIAASNFYDEEYEPSTLREVVAGVLQPLGLRIMQRNGKIWVYDINGLYSAAQDKTIEWSGDSQTLGVDKAVNNIKITFSPYDGAEVIDATINHDDVADRPGTKILYYIDNDWNGDQAVEGFNFVTGYNTAGLPLEVMTDGYIVQPFRIDSIYSGQDMSGMAWLWMGSRDDNGGDSLYRTVYGPAAAYMQTSGKNYPIPSISKMSDTDKIQPLFRTKKQFVRGYNSPFAASKYKLRICADILWDARYNPFESAALKNEEGNQGRHKEIKRIYIPARLILHGNDGNKYHYTNKRIVLSDNFIRHESSLIMLADGQTINDLPYGTCGWIRGEGDLNDFWLCYYNVSDPKSGYGEGWVTNHPCIGAANESKLLVPRVWAKRPDGEFIVPPPVDGEIELQICSGVATYFHDIFDETFLFAQESRWLLYKDLKIEWAKSDGEEIKGEDIEYSATINPAAKDELSIDSICGTMDDPTPNARGLYIETSTNTPIVEFQRASVADHPEMLLAATIYSQYAERHTTLSGEADIDCGDLTTYGERNQGDKRFMIVEETQNVIEDTTDIKIVEISADNYQAMKEANE